MNKKVFAACGCSKGKIRSNNEDNFYFNGNILPAENNALSTVLTAQSDLSSPFCTAVFDGMGGEQFGECAAFAAAHRMKDRLAQNPWNELPTEERLEALSIDLNAVVVEKARELLTRHMGSTLAGLLLEKGNAYSFNLGDSRVYLLRNRELKQISIDHVDSRAFFKKNTKPSLTQHLGIDEEEFLVEPSIVRMELQAGDRYLLCSDGLTDMVSDEQIKQLLEGADSASSAVRKLIDTALDNGGRDNITVIVLTVE